MTPTTESMAADLDGLEDAVLALHEALGGNGWAYSNYGNDELRYRRTELENGVRAVTEAFARRTVAGSAFADVMAERRRQVEIGRKPEHDDTYTDGQLAQAAAAYGLVAAGWEPKAAREIWPKFWDFSWWKPRDPRRNLVKAGALIIAEIERLDRLAAIRSPA